MQLTDHYDNEFVLPFYIRELLIEVFVTAKKESHNSAKATKASIENIISFYLCYFVIISAHSTCKRIDNYRGTKLALIKFQLR